jgi:hypothetical protein
MRTLLLPALLPLLAACGAKWSVDDADGDGISPAEGDCWDRPEGPEGSGLTGADIFPGAPDAWYDGYDQDCGGNDDFDADGDGWVPAAEHVGRTTFGVDAVPEHLGAGDCWDVDDDGEDRSPLNGYEALAAADVHPEAGEIWYDGVDADCAGDDDLDADADGFRSAAHEDRAGAFGDDCDDGDDAVNPGVPFEACNDIDDDCDGLLDGDDDNVAPGDTRIWAVDADADGFGALDSVVSSCSALEGHIEGDGTDCDDSSAAVFPGAEEVCNDADDDCDLLVDDADPDVNASIGGVVVYDDADGDGYGNVDTARFSCLVPGDAADNPLDCDDTDAAVQPDAQEVCDTIDNDCDGATDDEDDSTDLSTGITAYTDADGDGFGTASSPVQACEAPLGTAPNDDDCDDTSASRFPGAAETTGDEIDQDCDGGEICFVDADDDGYRLGSTIVSADADCTDAGEATAATPTGDCDDARAAVNPGATEVCDPSNTDEDCDGNADDADTGGATGKSTFYTDADADSYGDLGAPLLACDIPTGAVENADDCDDTDGAIRPGVAELAGDEVDQNCDAVETCYVDADNDGYRPNATATVVSSDLACTGSGEALATDPTGDCDDARSATRSTAMRTATGRPTTPTPAAPPARPPSIPTPTAISTEIRRRWSSAATRSPGSWATATTATTPPATSTPARTRSATTSPTTTATAAPAPARAAASAPSRTPDCPRPTSPCAPARTTRAPATRSPSSATSRGTGGTTSPSARASSTCREPAGTTAAWCGSSRARTPPRRSAPAPRRRSSPRRRSGRGWA